MGDEKKGSSYKRVVCLQIQFICIVSYGEFGEEEKALNLVEIIVEKSAIGIRICDF